MNTPTLDRFSRAVASAHPVAKRERREGLTIIYLGLLEWPRGLETAIRAIREVQTLLPSIRLMIVGSGRDQAYFEALVANLNLTDRVQFAGWLDYRDAIELVSSADIGLVPHHVVDSLRKVRILINAYIIIFLYIGVVAIFNDGMREQFYTLNYGRLIVRPVREAPAMEYLLLRLKAFVASHSHLFQLWRKFWYRKEIQETGLRLNQHVVNLLTGNDAKSMARGWQLTFKELAEMQKEGRTIGAKTAVVLLPLSLQLSNEHFGKFMASNDISTENMVDRKPQDTMIKFGVTEGVEMIDLLPVFKEWVEKRNEQLYLERDGHWNSIGHRVAADSVASELLRRRLLKGHKTVVVSVSHLSGIEGRSK